MRGARPVALVLLAGLLPLGCRGARRVSSPRDGGADDAPPAAARGPLLGFAPSRAGEGSQPRWRYLARGPRPRGVERWRYDLTPREPSGAPATDGRTVFIAAARPTAEGTDEGEVFAFDLVDGLLRWHTEVGGLHGEPVEFSEGVVLVDTVAHCATREDVAPGTLGRACRDARPGGLVGLDATTGRTLFRTAVSSGMLNAGWTVLRTSLHRWMHDGTSTLRDLALPGGALGARMVMPGTVLQGAAMGDDLLAVVDLRRTTAVQRRTPGMPRARWERMTPWRGSCAPVVAGPLLVLPGFAARGLAGAPRALATLDGADRWTATPPPETVQTCAAAEEGVLWQIRDNTLQGNSLFDGRARSPRALPAAPTSDVSALLDGVFYLSQPRALLGVEVSTGGTSVQLRTDARAVAGVILWAGRGVVVTREPGLVLGFD